jgi:hypothetical protein
MRTEEQESRIYFERLKKIIQLSIELAKRSILKIRLSEALIQFQPKLAQRHYIQRVLITYCIIAVANVKAPKRILASRRADRINFREPILKNSFTVWIIKILGKNKKKR